MINLNLERSKKYVKIMKGLDSLLNPLLSVVGISGSSGRGVSSPRNSKFRNKMEYKKSTSSYKNSHYDFRNIGFYGHNIMRNHEILLLNKYKKEFNSPIIDIGCGNGNFTSLLLEKVDAGIDLMSHNVEESKRFGLYDIVKISDCTKHIPFENNSFGTAISNSVVEHIPNLDGLVGEVSRILKSKGHCFFTTYNSNFTKFLIEIMGKKNALAYNSSLTHVSLYDKEYWESLFNKHQMKIVICDYYLTKKALINMISHSNNFFRGLNFLFGDFYWELYKKKMAQIITESLHSKEEKAGMLLIAEKI